MALTQTEQQLVLKAIDTLSKEVGNLRTDISDLGKEITRNTLKIEHLGETSAKLVEIVRTGNGHPSLVAEVRQLKADKVRATTEGGTVALARVKASKEVWLAIVIAFGAAFASVVSLLKS